MGMNAVYMLIDTKTLDSLVELEQSELSETICDIEEDDDVDRIDLAKNWDILHYYLTGVSASTPIEGNMLSEAVVGVHNFSYEDGADFITCTECDELKEIIEALQSFDMKANKDRLEPKVIQKLDLYPKGIGQNEDVEKLYQEIESEIKSLITFYTQALEQQLHVVISIL